MPHEDGAAYAPVVATVTLGGHCVLDLYDKQTAGDATGSKTSTAGHQKPRYRILQEPRSLLVTRGDAYKSFLHGIGDLHEDINLSKATITNWHLLGNAEEYSLDSKSRELRVSLTFRDVLKVSNVGSKLFGKGI